ncbi:uncharacterized protein BX663DRAFT_520733 [Cokeromyces recurvatus]|uniref:uncharacterized protein n=1 Tax=Cokeromyces recurvatus TaxID=90255 RepID=UPI00221FD402|nr:uncharacterized protein BX663DRAFT_520733 [Cokeromyces recurvatus]KAI7899618.1 hypothetical protein BX663DRAFT_520733 [Cokeromyces recurvatus]
MIVKSNEIPNIKVPNLKSNDLSYTKNKNDKKEDNGLTLTNENSQELNIKRMDYSLDISCHPTTPIFEDDEVHRQGYLKTVLENNSRERKYSFSEHCSSQEMNSFNALCPPSRSFKAHRLSKNTMDASTSLFLSSKKERKALSMIDGCSKDNNNNNHSAVSPRFMVLRKLSEVSTLPSNSLSYSLAPHTSHERDEENRLTIQEENEDVNSKRIEYGLLHKMDDLMKAHLAQITWKISESHLDARRIWEEQRKEMISFTETITERLIETQADIQRNFMLESTHSPSLCSSTKSVTLEESNMFILENGSNLSKTKHDQVRQPLFDLEHKQHNIEEQITKPSDQANKIMSLEIQNKQLKKQLKELSKRTCTYEEIIKKQNIELKQLGCKHIDTESLIHSNKQEKDHHSTAKNITNCHHHDSTVDNQKSQSISNWADMMESEDEIKKITEEWAEKYEELQSKYFNLRLKLESSSDDKIKIYNLNQSMTEKDEEIRQLKQAISVNRIQLEYLQLEINKYQKMMTNKVTIQADQNYPAKQKKNTLDTATSNLSTEPAYVVSNGFLSFTTEINGRPFKYIVKIPNGNQLPKKETFNKPNSIKDDCIMLNNSWKNNTKYVKTRK